MNYRRQSMGSLMGRGEYKSLSRRSGAGLWARAVTLRHCAYLHVTRPETIEAPLLSLVHGSLAPLGTS
jgi:hypothetical protein